MKLHHLFEQSKGQQVIAFARYLDSDRVPKKHKSKFEELGGQLFSLGYSFSDDVASSPRFSRDESHVMLPAEKYFGISTGVDVLYQDSSQGKFKFASGFFKIDNVLELGIEKILQDIKEKAR